MAGVIYMFQAVEEVLADRLCKIGLWPCDNSPEVNNVAFVGVALAAIGVTALAIAACANNTQTLQDRKIKPL